MLLAGENLDNFGDVKNILVEMGTYFQVQVMLLFFEGQRIWICDIVLPLINDISLQDDYLDCFGDPEFIGKVSCLHLYFLLSRMSVTVGSIAMALFS